MILTILQHTPVWVFALLLALIALGASQVVPRTVTMRRSVVMPVVMLGLSLSGVLTAFGAQALALPVWAAGLVATLLAMHGRVDTRAVRFSAATGEFQVPGSWWPLVLVLGLFSIKYGMGVALAMQPQWRESALVATLACATYGAFSGVFLGRAVALWTLARQPMRVQPA